MLNIRGVIEVEGFSDEVVGDPGAHLHAASYIETLAASATGYRECMELLTNGTSCDDRVKFHLLAVVKEYVNERYTDETAEGRDRMKRFLKRYISVQNNSTRYDSEVIRLAAAQIHVIVFEFDYVLHWNNYFDDIVNSAYMGIKTVDHTLRIMDLTSLWLKSSEEVEQKMPDEFREIQLAREFLQVNDLPRVITFLSNVIIEYEPMEVIALKVIHDMLTWIDTSFFDELKIVDIITSRLRTVEAWEVAVDCFVMMTKRVQTPALKQKMLETVFELTTERLNALAPSEFHSKIGQLHNAIGISLIASHEEAMKSWRYDLSSVLRDMISELFDKVQSFLEQPDPESSMSVAGFTLRYVKLMEKHSLFHKKHITALFKICVDKMKLEINLNDLPDDVVNVYRAALSETFKYLTRVDKYAAHKMILDMQKAVLADGVDQADVEELELSMYLLQLYCEARNDVALNQITLELDCLLCQLVGRLVTSDFWKHPHPTIIIRFFKTLSVGITVMATEPTQIRQIVALFVSESCIAHQHCEVRESCTRFLRDMVANLPARVAIPDNHRVIDKVVALAVDEEAFSEDSRLNLHETLALFVKIGNLTQFERRQLHGEIMNSALVKLREHTFTWQKTQAKFRDTLASGVCFAINIVIRSTLAFDNYYELKDAGCGDNYLSIFEAFIHIPVPILMRGDIRGCMRQLTKRLVFVLAEKFLPSISDVIHMICTTSAVPCITEDTDLLVFLIDRYGHKLVPTLRTEFAVIGESIYLPTALALSKEHGLSDGPLKEEFERNYVRFMRAIVRNNIFDQVFRQGQQAHICSVIYILSSGCYPSVLPHDTFQTFAAYLKMEPSEMLMYLDMVTEEVKRLFMTDFELENL